jgi:hypothetical protein
MKTKNIGSTGRSSSSSSSRTGSSSTGSSSNNSGSGKYGLAKQKQKIATPISLSGIGRAKPVSRNSNSNSSSSSSSVKSVVRNSSSNTTSSNTTSNNTTSSSGVDNGGWETAKSKKKDKKEKKDPRKDPRTDTSNNGYGANPNDWECPNCNINVFANRDECYRCHAQKPKTKPLPSSLKPRAQQAKPSSKKKQLHDPKIAQIRSVIGMQPTDGRVKELLRLTRGDVNQAVSLFYETGRLLSTPEESSGGGGGGGGGGTDDDGWETVDHR